MATKSGLHVNRIEALTDGVFAIAMTILVLGLKLPGGTGSVASRMWTLWPQLASYVLSFVMLGVLWIGHHYQLNHLRHTNRGLIWINLFFLLSITFLPFGADVLGAAYADPGAVVLYAGTILLSGVALLAHWRYAMRHPELLVPELDPAVSRGLQSRIVAGLAVSAASIGVAFVDTRASLIVLLLLPIGYWLRTPIDERVAPRA